MTYVVTAACINCKYTDCVEVCPVDCFVEGENYLAIDPELCVDCHLCVPECPVEAIYPEEEVPEGQEHYTALNMELAKEWEPITEVIDPLPDADAWAAKPNAEKEGKLIR